MIFVYNKIHPLTWFWVNKTQRMLLLSWPQLHRVGVLSVKRSYSWVSLAVRGHGKTALWAAAVEPEMSQSRSFMSIVVIYDLWGGGGDQRL